MEALSGVASGMAVASLTIQLIDSIITIKAFIRKVKDTPKELDRLVQLLDRLGALLEDVRNMIEHQTSLERNQFPLPPKTIFMWLKGCESSLEPLEDIVRKQSSRRQKKSPSSRSNLWFALKSKDISAWEEAIQHDIHYLNSAMMVNQTTILLHAPTMLLGSSHSPNAQGESCAASISSVTCASSSANELIQVDGTIAWTSRTSLIPTRLERFGVQLQRYSRSMVMVSHKTAPSPVETEEIIVGDTYSWNSRWLQRGISWRRQRSYGSILPSLTTYPIVESFYFDLPKPLMDATILEVQRWFSTNLVHPYTRDKFGSSLLHEAAECHRQDLCQLLIQHGVRPDLNVLRASPLIWSISSFWLQKSTPSSHNVVDTLRTVLDDADALEEFMEPSTYMFSRGYRGPKATDVSWLWSHCSKTLCTQELLALERFLYAQSLIAAAFDTCDRYFSASGATERKDASPFFLQHKLSAETKAGFERGEYDLLSYFFRDDIYYDGSDIGAFAYHLRDLSNSCDSSVMGQALLDVLAQSSFNVDLIITKEIENLPELSEDFGCEKKFVYRGTEDGGPALQWQWIHDVEAEAYLLVSELTAFASDHFFADEWPFRKHGYWKGLEERCPPCQARQDTRSQRRQLKRSRKNLRLRRKQGVDIMPGTWR